MATVIASNGTPYYLFPFTDIAVDGGRSTVTEPEESIEINTLDNDLSNGYFSSALFGSAAGLRTFTLKLPTLIHSSTAPGLTVTGINGDTLSREQVIWELYCENKVSGTPFVYQSSRNGQYYLVRFIDDKLTYARMIAKLYSTGITLQQVRMSGVTVTDVSQFASAAYNGFVRQQFLGDTAFVSSSWVESIMGNDGLDVSAGDVTSVSSVVNGHAVKRFNSSANTGYGISSFAAALTSEFFIVMKMREATFSNAAGIFTGSTATQLLLGSSGTTKFANPSLSATAFTYRLNGLAYAQSNMQAPMNTFGIVHVRYTTGFGNVSHPQFGRDRTAAGTYAKMDVAEIITAYAPLPATVGREITEYLAVKYAITI